MSNLKLCSLVIRKVNEVKYFKKNSYYNNAFKVRSSSCGVRPLEEVPSPKSYPIIGHAHLFFRNGKFD